MKHLNAEYILRVFRSDEPKVHSSGVPFACLAAIEAGHNTMPLLCKAMHPTTQRTIQTAVRSLERAGFVRVRRRGSAGASGRRCHLYSLLP